MKCIKLEADLRMFFPAVRDQGVRPLCLVFCASDLNSKKQGLTDALSVEYLAHYSYSNMPFKDFSQGLYVDAVSKAIYEHGQPKDYCLPYVPNQFAPSTPTGSFSDLYYASGSGAITAMASILTSIDSGIATGLVLELSDSFFTLASPYVVDGHSQSLGLHAVIAVGYGTCGNGEKYLLIRNSWGANWGWAGHAWITSEFYMKNVIQTMEIK